MKIILISGSGIGAGKTFAGHRLADTVLSLADGIRQELLMELPAYNWFDRSQAFKAGTTIVEHNNMSARDVMIIYGQEKCRINKAYWAERLANQIEETYCADPMGAAQVTYAIDDVRKLVEVQTFRERFPGQVLHVHIVFNDAIPEPQYENDELAAIADYLIFRNH